MSKSGPTPLSKEVSLQRFEDKRVRILEPYQNKRQRAKFECLDCGHVFNQTCQGVWGKKSKGCPKCGVVFKLDQEEVSRRFKEANIELLEPYTNKRDKLKMNCLTCGNEWSAICNSIFRGSGCPECFKRRYAEQRSVEREEYLRKYGDWDAYKKYVRSLTYSNVKKYNLFEDVEIGRFKNNIDHIRSVKQCFNDGILPFIVASPVNLQILWWKDNNKKRTKSTLTKEELINKYGRWKETHE